MIADWKLYILLFFHLSIRKLNLARKSLYSKRWHGIADVHPYIVSEATYAYLSLI